MSANRSRAEAGRPGAPRRNLVSLARPFFGLIVFSTLALAALGFVLMRQMPSGIYPKVAFPRISVIARSPGLAVRNVEVAVTRPIEDAVGVVLGVRLVRSKTVREAVETDIHFAPGTDMVQALNDVRARLAEIGNQFPPGTSLMVERQTPAIFPIVSFVVTGGRDLAALREYAYYNLRPRISRIDDVSYVTVEGGDVREIEVEVDPQRLVAAGLSLADVADRLGKEHHLRAVGRIDRGTLQYQVISDTQAASPLALADYVVDHKHGQWIRLKDLGRVVVAHEDRTLAIRSDGQDAVALTVFRRLGGDALRISRDLDALLADARKSAPPSVSIVPVYDQGLLVRTAIANVRDAMAVGGLFSVLVLFAFLKNLRATLIAALAIPLSLAVSFVFLRLSGDTLNLMSLGGLAVAIGLIIDDSVVVIENIARHLAEGQSGDEAIDRASKEISGAVIGSTLTTILVFVPLAFVHGVIGQFFQSLSLALAIALLVSMVVSLTVVPVLAARFLAQRRMPASGPIYDRLATGYERFLRAGLRFPRTTVALALLAVLPGWWLFHHLESGFMPEMDEGAFILDYRMPEGTSLAETDRVLRRVEAVLLDTPGLAGYIRRTGAENGLYVTEPFRGDILVSLEPPGRRRSSEAIIDDLRQRLARELPQVDTEFAALVSDQINDLNGVERPVEVKVFGPDRAQLRRLAGQAGQIVEGCGGKDVNAHRALGNPDIVIRCDSAETARLGLTATDVENQLNAALYGQVAATLPEQDRLTDIRVRYPDAVRFDREALPRLPVSLPAAAAAATPEPSPRPGFVPLGQLGSIDTLRSPNAVWRENQQPVVTVTAELGDRDLGSLNRDIAARMARLEFPSGYRWELAGDYRAQQETFASLLGVLIVASAMVFLLLGFQFRSLLLPLLIFLSQPISLTSALLALAVTHTPLNVSSFMGMILLIGLDVKNGIILIEYIGQLAGSGMPLDEALVRAGRTRFRPILMTGLATIFGLAPLALGLGPGAQMQQPLAIAVIGGLVANMLLTRLLVPVGYRVIRSLASSP